MRCRPWGWLWKCIADMGKIIEKRRFLQVRWAWIIYWIVKCIMNNNGSKRRASKIVCAKSLVTMRRWPEWQRWLQQGREVVIVWWYLLHRLCGGRKNHLEVRMRIRKSTYLTSWGHDIWKACTGKLSSQRTTGLPLEKYIEGYSEREWGLKECWW